MIDRAEKYQVAAAAATATAATAAAATAASTTAAATATTGVYLAPRNIHVTL